VFDALPQFPAQRWMAPGIPPPMSMDGPVSPRPDLVFD
jgi:hypothetical protein